MNTSGRIMKRLGSTAVCIALFSLPVWAQKTIQLTDPEIASVAVTANQIDVNYGKIALKKSKNADIRKFAQTMVKDHTSIIAQAAALAKKLGVTLKDNALTQQLLAGEKKTGQMLKSKTGSAFDKAYINNEVAYHEAVVNTVKDVLIPQAQNQELKSLLQKVLPLLNEHLEMAKHTQAKF
jgi:putative membrane protein